MGKVFHLFGGGEPEPEEEPEFNLDDEIIHLSGYWDDILAAHSPLEVKELVAKMVVEVAEWPNE